MFKSSQIDQFEYTIDLICIEHGLGFQLYNWSHFVRKALNMPEWKGAFNGNKTDLDQRYMSPVAIIKQIISSAMYPKRKFKRTA